MSSILAARPNITIRQLKRVLEALDIHVTVGTIIDLLIYLDIDVPLDAVTSDTDGPIELPSSATHDPGAVDDLANVFAGSIDIDAEGGPSVPAARSARITSGSSSANPVRTDSVEHASAFTPRSSPKSRVPGVRVSPPSLPQTSAQVGHADPTPHRSSVIVTPPSSPPAPSGAPSSSSSRKAATPARQHAIAEGLAAANSWYCVVRGRKAGAVRGWVETRILTHGYSGNLQFKCDDEEDAIYQFKKFWMKGYVRSGDGTYVGVQFTDAERQQKARLSGR